MSRIAALVGLLVAACATTPHSYKLYPGPERPTSELAVVRLADAGIAEIDGREATYGDWTEVHVLPGTHTIRWEREFLVSVLVEASGFATGGDGAELELEAGHVYALRADRTTGPGYQMYFWIVDETTRQVVAGTPKP